MSEPVRIKRRVLRMVFESARDSHPEEFAALLKKNRRGIISQLWLLPGTIRGESSATFPLHMKPVDFDVVGTVHSHPTPNCIPSKADLAFFERFGDIHIIVGYPYDDGSWQGYDRSGRPRDVHIV